MLDDRRNAYDLISKKREWNNCFKRTQNIKKATIRRNKNGIMAYVP